MTIQIGICVLCCAAQKKLALTSIAKVASQCPVLVSSYVFPFKAPSQGSSLKPEAGSPSSDSGGCDEKEAPATRAQVPIKWSEWQYVPGSRRQGPSQSAPMAPEVRDTLERLRRSFDETIGKYAAQNKK